VRVYAGTDPVTKKRHYLTEIIPPGPKARRTAEDALRRLVSEVKERRNPRTNATVDQLLERYMSQFDGSPNTLVLYEGYIRLHISPMLGSLKVGDLDADILDSFYAELRRCRIHCSGKKFVQHRTKGDHVCDDRCGPHECKPLNASTVRSRIHPPWTRARTDRRAPHERGVRGPSRHQLRAHGRAGRAPRWTACGGAGRPVA
jgi:hypothetical protein